jgi:hypothetical protein
MFFADLSRPSKQLTGSVDGGSLGLALLLQKALEAWCAQFRLLDAKVRTPLGCEDAWERQLDPVQDEHQY